MNLSTTNTVSNMHTYTIDWKPDSISWAIDGKVLRTKKRSETWNATSNRYDFPQTPSRVMLSLWPAGLSTNGKGTIDWAGGLVDWNSPYMQNGFYYARVEDVTVECYDPPPGATKKGSKSYIYTDPRGTNDTVQIVDNVVILKSIYATGEKPDNDPLGSGSKSSTSSGAKSTPTELPETVPGVSGAGERGGESENQAGQSAGGTGTGSSGASETGSASSGFSQGGNTAGKSGAAKVEGRAVMGGSILAGVVALVALCVL